MAPVVPLDREILNLHNLAARGEGMIALALKPVIRPDVKRGLEPLHSHVLRDSDSDDGSDNMINLALSILGLVFFALLLASGLFFLRRHRRAQRIQGETLPVYQQVSRDAKSHGLTIETKHNGHSSIVYIGRDGQPMLQNPQSPPDSPDNVPQIQITFPDEQDEQGQRKSGRVLIVRVGDNATVGLEPIQDDQLPAYEKEANGQFQSIDMDQIGGLKEKERFQ